MNWFLFILTWLFSLVIFVLVLGVLFPHPRWTPKKKPRRMKDLGRKDRIK